MPQCSCPRQHSMQGALLARGTLSPPPPPPCLPARPTCPPPAPSSCSARKASCNAHSPVHCLHDMTIHPGRSVERARAASGGRELWLRHLSRQDMACPCRDCCCGAAGWRPGRTVATSRAAQQARSLLAQSGAAHPPTLERQAGTSSSRGMLRARPSPEGRCTWSRCHPSQQRVLRIHWAPTARLNCRLLLSRALGDTKAANAAMSSMSCMWSQHPEQACIV